MKQTLCGIFSGVGLIAIGVGVWFIHWPSALIVMGVLLIADAKIASAK